jgi:AraC family transcriptional regulator, transcriptional activator of pobA
MEIITIKEFYKDVFEGSSKELDNVLGEINTTDIGHFNVFNIKDFYKSGACGNHKMPYNRRTYYKISLIKGKNKVEYADREIEINDFAILFATPKIPYRYTPQDGNQEGHFCVFTNDFITKTNSGIVIDDLPIFKANSDFIYEIDAKQAEQFESIFKKMHAEIATDYAYKYDLLRNYLFELIHQGQKLKPIVATKNGVNAATRISTLFVELLERQFPIESPHQVLKLRTAKDYADTLQVHINHLNKVLKEMTGKTTSEIISSRIVQESKFLMRQTTWNISEIAFSLGFEEVAHFSNFFRKQTNIFPSAYRDKLFDLHK